jgi:type I restriction enzyme S subunit
MSEVAQVPQLRFPEFSGEWEEKRFDSLYPTVRNGFVGVATPYYVEEGVPYLQGKNIKSGAINRNGLVYINESFHQKSKKSQLRQNDIVMVQSGHVGECAVITEEFEDTNCHALLVSTPTHDIDSKFYINYFYSKFGRKKIYRITTGNTIKHILSSDLKIQTVSNPSYQEQQKIAAFLAAVDSKIEQLSKKQELLKEYKKGLMQQIFSQVTRFKADDGCDFPDWEEKKLGDVSVRGTSNISANQLEDNNGDYKIYGAAGHLKNIDFYTEEDCYVAIVKDGAGVGRIMLLESKTSVLGTLAIIKAKQGNDINFLYWLIQTINFRKYVVGSTIPHIYYRDYQAEKLRIPSLSEQTKIANFLSFIDSKIEQVGKQLDESKQFKKALLQQMFV